MITNSTTPIPLENRTERELQQEADALREIARRGDATLAQANRLAKLENALRRIHAVRSGKAWE